MRETPRGLSAIRVERSRLLETLKKNRTDHAKEYEEALVGWRTSVIDRLKANLAKAEGGEKDLMSLLVSHDLPRPECYDKDFDKAIMKVEFSMDKEFDLSSQEFEQFIMNHWSWTDHFKSLSTSYAGAARR